MSSLIGKIGFQPISPRSGETVRLEVLNNESKTIDESRITVTINGIPGAVQYLQFPTAGQRRIVVRAVTADGLSERKTTLLDVKEESLKFLSSGNREDIAMLGVSQSATQPYQAILTLGSFINTRSPSVLSLKSEIPPKLIEHLSPSELTESIRGLNKLENFMINNTQNPVRVETRRLSNISSHQSIKQVQGSTSVEKRKPKLVKSAIYDLTDVDLNSVFGDIGTVQERRFEWDYGDGTTATTSSPIVAHDYFTAIDHSKGKGQFVVTCKIAHSNITVKRTLTIYSAYAICKRMGTIVPHVTSEIFAHKRYNLLAGTFTAYNVEDNPIILDCMSVTAIADDGDTRSLPSSSTNLENPIRIMPKSSVMIGVNVPFVLGTPKTGELRYNIKGFSVLYSGTCGNYSVRCSATFDVPVAEWDIKPEDPYGDISVPELTTKPWPWEMVEDILEQIINPADPALNPGEVGNPIEKLGKAMLDKKTGTVAVSLGTLQDKYSISKKRTHAMKLLSAVYAPVNSKIIEKGNLKPSISSHTLHMTRKLGSSSKVTQGNIGASLNTSVAKKLPQPGPVAEGQICDPDNLTEEELAQANAGQLVCQLTTETMDVKMPARWMNALKGDIILSPGGDGIIGGLLMNLNLPQLYSHSGMMTRNYDEITHSTGSQSRLMDHRIGVVSEGSDGFEPSVLKYFWPGVVTQSVQNSIEGELFPDPEYNKTYSISSFGPHTIGITHNDQMVMIPPLVLKPDQETPAVRATLHAIATDARNAGGRPGVNSKYHYRWYCYTDPTIGRGPVEGPDAGWAAGTLPCVCSSFIWLLAKGRNAHLESNQSLVTPTDLEQKDMDQEAMVRPTTPDGLYTYSAEERLAAANWLYDTIYNQAYEQAGFFGNIATDAADDIANQFLNAFINDDADGKDSTEWQNVGVADAVSPNDLLWWDKASAGGLYGYAEPAIYREPRVESYQVSRWKKVLTRGTIRGRIFDAEGNVTSNALVQVYDSKTTSSGNDGSFTLTDVPLGKYMLKASKVIDGILQSTQIEVNLNIAELVLDVHLQPPADRYRIAQMFIDFWGRDDEWWPASDEIHDPSPEYFELELGPDKLINSAHHTYKWGGEMRMEYDITLRLLVNNTIDVAVQGTLYEGTSEDNDDLDGQGGLTFQVPVGQTTGATLSITNTDEDAGDKGIFSISVKNVRNNN